MATVKRISMQPFFDYLKEEAKNRSIYCLGAQGEIAGEVDTNFIVSHENTLNNASRVLKHLADLVLDVTWKRKIARAFDCSGLGCYYLQNKMGVYKWDHTANDMYKECVKIAEKYRQPGDFVFAHFTEDGKAGHVGYIDDEGMVVESKGRDDGVVRRDYEAGKWVCVGRPDVWEYEMKRELHSGSIGPDVGQLQARLTHFGYNCGEVDNVFGIKTHNALAKFQDAKYPKAPEKGVMDKKTAKKLGFAYNAG